MPCGRNSKQPEFQMWIVHRPWNRDWITLWVLSALSHIINFQLHLLWFLFFFFFMIPLCCACSSQDSSLLALLQYMQICSYFRNFLLFFLFPLWDLPIQPKNNSSPKSWVYLLLAQCFIYDSNSYHFLIFSIITSTFFLVIFLKYGNNIHT